MRILYRLLLCLIFFTGLQSLQAQDNTWFVDVTEDVGFTDVPAWRLYVTDVNGDEYPDLMIINGINKRNQLSLWLNMPDPESGDAADRIFVDVTEQSGINANINPQVDGRVADVGALADIDNDGDVDLVTGRFYYSPADYEMPEDRAAVMLNDGNGVFTLVDGNGLDGITLLNATGLSYFDYNLDGLLDLYVGTFSLNHQASSYMADYLMQGMGNGTFADVSQESRIGWTSQPLYGSNICDWNNDGWPDVLTSPYCRTSGSLWRNNKDGTFTDVAFEAGYSTRVFNGDNGQNLCQWEGMPADFDNDGDFDVLQVLVHGGYHTNEGRTVLSVNQGEEAGYRFEWQLDRVRRDAPNNSHLGDMSGSWVDFDNDGWLDLVINQSQYPQANVAGVERSYFLKQNDSNYFDDVTASLGLADKLLAPGASEVIDYDRDGDDDLLIVVNTNRNQNNTLKLLRNDIGDDNNWVGIRLNAPDDVNRNAIGARIKVTAGGMTQMRELTAGHGHFGGQQPLIQNIGIGENESIERIEVRWPNTSLSTTVVENPPVNRIITIEKNGLAGVEGGDDVAGQMLLSPNPVDDMLNVRLPQGFRHSGSARITDALGRDVAEHQVMQGVEEFVLPVRELDAGYYFLHLEGIGGNNLSRPFIVR